MESPERYNRTLIERARSMLLVLGLPLRFWEHAVRYANWVTNRVPTSGLLVMAYHTHYRMEELQTWRWLKFLDALPMCGLTLG